MINLRGGPEAALCLRTTLLPGLRDAFYRLPEAGGAVYTPDVLVFRAGGPGAPDLACVGRLQTTYRTLPASIAGGPAASPSPSPAPSPERRSSARNRACSSRSANGLTR